MTLCPIILSGGSGTRLWPLSRELYPKQLLPLTGDLSMLQETVGRLAGLDLPEVRPPLVICNEAHRFMVAEQMRQIGCKASAILLEPVGRNTAPALTLAALRAESAADTVLLVMPADHIIRDCKAFHNAVRTGYRLAVDDHLVTFGIVPTAPETGYGYIKIGHGLDGGPIESAATGYAISDFVEKPDAASATAYLASGEYLWNSGIFMMKASVWLAAIAKYRPDILDACRASYEKGRNDLDFYRIDAAQFESCPSDSIDYAVMEKFVASHAKEEGDKSVIATQASVVPIDAGWSDVGAWSALWAVQEKDEYGNVLKGDVISMNTRNALLSAETRLLAVIGLDDIIVVETADAVLVSHKDAVQDVKKVVNQLKKAGRNETLSHRRVHRPWGTYETIDIGERYQVKRITVKPSAALSLQMHHHRAEHWVVVTGTAKVTRGDETYLVAENQSTYIPVGVKHRLENPGKYPLEMIEVQSGSYLGEDDIVRYEDKYGR